jgi:hypothetical protein
MYQLETDFYNTYMDLNTVCLCAVFLTFHRYMLPASLHFTLKMEAEFTSEASVTLPTSALHKHPEADLPITVAALSEA